MNKLIYRNYLEEFLFFVLSISTGVRANLL